MYHKTIFHTLQDGTKAKFTIQDRMVEGERFYFASIINIELDWYKSKTATDQEHTFGIEITNGRQQAINYRDPDRLVSDILTKYGRVWLESEK